MMDGAQFDNVLRSLSESRRSLLGGALALAGGWLAAGSVDASRKHRNKDKRKKRHKKPNAPPQPPQPEPPQPPPPPQPNAYGCLDVGKACDGDSSRCCSGICEGAGPTSICAGHNELGCDAAGDTCSESVPCGATGVCYRSTGKAGFCGDFRVCNCLPCQKDADCQLDYGPGAACVVCTGDCAGINHSQGTACVPAAA